MSEWLSSKTLQICAGKGVEERKSFYTVRGNVNWYSHYGKQYETLIKQLKTELLYDRASPTLHKYPERKMKILIQKAICTPMFIAALSIIATTWQQPNCPSTGNWLKRLWGIHI